MKTITHFFTIHPNLHWLLVLLVIVVTLAISGCKPTQDKEGNDKGTKEYVEAYYLKHMLPEGATIFSATKTISSVQYDNRYIYIKFYFENECFMMFKYGKHRAGITKVDCP